MNLEELIFEKEKINIPNLDSTLIKDNEISINSDKMREITLTSELISNLIDGFNLPYPHKFYSKDDIVSDFKALLNFNIDDLIIKGICFTKISRDGLPKFYLNNKSIGRVSSDYFQRENRIKTSSISSTSPYNKWYKSSHRNWIKYAIEIASKKGYLNSEILRSAVSQKFIAGQFPPIIAKYLFNKFKAKNILDFSAGWGDRLCGFYASQAESYVGVDPNSNLHSSYKLQADFYSKLINSKKESTFICECAEDVSYGDMKFDMLFTSSPYFKTERYCEEENQSYIKYKTLEDWLSHFLFKSIENALPHMISDGFICINIADTFLYGKEMLMCDKLLDYMKEMPVEFIGVLPFRCPVFSSKQKDKIGTPVECIFIWKVK